MNSTVPIDFFFLLALNTADANVQAHEYLELLKVSTDYSKSAWCYNICSRLQWTVELNPVIESDFHTLYSII